MRSARGPGGVAGMPGELSLMDKGVKSLKDVSLSSDLHTLNAHCNLIARIQGLDHLRNLQHLDLSSNQIRRIEGLDSLAKLRTLSLSCNLLTKVEGLEKLFNLTMLNLSYNRIHDLSGFQSLHGTRHKISHIDLHSNCVSNINHLLQCTKGLRCLTNLTLERNGKANPVCHVAGYRETVLQSLPQLTALDGRNISGESVDPAEENCSDFQCFEDILGSLVSSGCPSTRDQNNVPLPLATPHIDQALAQFRQRTRIPVQGATSSSTELVSSSESEKNQLDKIHSEMRIKRIEEQILQILQKVSDSSRQEAAPSALKAKRDTDPTSESENESGKENNRKVMKGSKIPTYRKPALSTKGHASHLKKKITVREEKKSSSKCPCSSQNDSHFKVVGRKAEILTGRQSNMEKAEECNSNHIEESTYQALIQELDQEKERRWKAEQAEKKLLVHISELQEHAKEEKNIQSMAVFTRDRLKELILEERNAKARLQADVQQLKGETERLTNELNQAKNKEAEYQRAMRALEETLSKMETQRLQQRAAEMKQVQEAELKASANEREVQLLRISVRQQKEKVKQLHELLVLREQEQRKELGTRVALNGPEFQDALAKEVAKEEQRHEQCVRELQEKIDLSNQKYRELEDEFRLALTIEAKRFKEVKQGFEKASADLAEHKQDLFELEQREKDMASLIQDLTNLVEEQKAKIAELTKSNEEATANLKCQTGELEAVIEEDKQKAVQVELLKKENVKLISQLTAQESVIDGLKMERKIWGQELAEQGAHLAQDRGKLEAKIEVLTNEIVTLKKQKEHDSDTIKIKNKIVDDQTETIRRLKEGLQEKDKQIKKHHEENREAQKLLQIELDERAAECEKLIKKLERQNERKEELKQLLEEKEVELDDIKNAHSALKKRWQGKAELLSQLEVQVKQMKENFDFKEKKLIEERNKSLQTQRIAVEKLHKMDNAFRKQLESVLAAHQEELLHLENEKEKQIEAANEKVYSVEEEMRELLQEMASNKKAMENKIRRLTHALNDIQQDFEDY
ncbi:Leucine-rich repeat and coiled-coil domain-containing protein 1 [Lonchura striata]|uniref:Leucine-rich repeat and coiled-coil domain-containing protein 1 n=1 Tax=Lonchura striata TaxID=40157 RepID=A0A218V289_9PASE|nr:leucine-rich repeat and coiled-coil domain-containing protein 1 [Lonchura striata domestica]OWK60008.1 Leucine-rich repeat and coiled-coil domain-containing protein 1 [Lonchura striata domestica]